MPCPLFLNLLFSKKKQDYWWQVTEICQTLFMVSVAYGLGDRMRSVEFMHPPTSHFQKCLDVGLYNFSIISNFFDSDKPYVKHA